jgi:hypothetical protein
MGLYEPLNQSLATLSLRTIPMMRPAMSNSRHPESQRPYFEEYAPLFSDRKAGLRGYRPDFAYDSFFLTPDVQFPELRNYIESLLNLARASGKVPVIKFCRTLGRVEWFRRNFPDAAHIFVMRDPRSQWMSAWRLSREDDNPHHLLAPIRILALHRNHPLVTSVLDAMRIRAEDFVLPDKHAAVCKAVRKTPAQLLYRGFLAFWVLSSFLAYPECDMTIETERLSDSDFRVTTQQVIDSLTGLSIDLSDAYPIASLAGANDFFGANLAGADALQALARLEALKPGGGNVSRFLGEKLTEQIRIAS